MRICIHRGTKEIGGTCVEVESQGERIVVDIGLPLDETESGEMPLHPVPGFDKPDDSLPGVVRRPSGASSSSAATAVRS